MGESMEDVPDSSDVRTPPAWITKEFIQSSLRKTRNDNSLVVAECVVSFACPFGKNFTSEVLRISARLKNGSGAEESVSLILKCLAAAGEVSKVTDLNDDYKRETLMVSEVLVDVYRMLAFCCEDFEAIGAQYYASGNHPTQYIILEDLAVSGYQMANGESLDLKHCLLVIRSIAMYHAATAALLQKNGELKDEFEVAVMFTPETTAIMRPFSASALRLISEEAAGWHESPKDLPQRILNQIDKIQDRLHEIAKYRPGKFNVIVHGDLWTNNLMFKYSQEQVQSVRLLDFQKSYVSSPAVDLLYLLYTSLNEHVRANSMEYIIREYHKHLTDTLKALGYNSLPYTLQDLKDDISEYQVMNLFTSFYILPLFIADQFDINAAMNGDINEMRKGYSPKYFEIIRNRMSVFLELALL